MNELTTALATPASPPLATPSPRFSVADKTICQLIIAMYLFTENPCGGPASNFTIDPIIARKMDYYHVVYAQNRPVLGYDIKTPSSGSFLRSIDSQYFHFRPTSRAQENNKHTYLPNHPDHKSADIFELLNHGAKGSLEEKWWLDVVDHEAYWRDVAWGAINATPGSKSREMPRLGDKIYSISYKVTLKDCRFMQETLALSLFFLYKSDKGIVAFETVDFIMEEKYGSGPGIKKDIEEAYGGEYQMNSKCIFDWLVNSPRNSGPGKFCREVKNHSRYWDRQARILYATYTNQGSDYDFTAESEENRDEGGVHMFDWANKDLRPQTRFD
ncbi:hypothetical protein MMC28_011501 [Mycoblastus sanguinarius]|nr:hypothetical protein [Mycoblastus sanguinarius]